MKMKRSQLFTVGAKQLDSCCQMDARTSTEIWEAVSRQMGRSPQRALPADLARRGGIRHWRKLERIAIGPHAPKNEEAAIGDHDIAFLKQAIVHCRFGSDPLELGCVGRLSLDAARLCGNGDARGDQRSDKGC